MRPPLLLLLASLALPGLFAAPAAAQGIAQDLSEEARRQIQLARDDLAAGQYERAIQACESALRLDSTQIEALKLKGLALEGLGNKDDAMAMFLAYNTFRSGLEPDQEVEDALDRLDKKRRRARKKEEAAAGGSAPALNPAPIILMGAGAGLAAAGFVMHGVAYEEGIGIALGEWPDDKEYYEELYGQNVAGLALGIAGVATLGAGVGVLIATLAAPKDDAPVAFSISPVLTPTGIAGGSFLLQGSFR